MPARVYYQAVRGMLLECCVRADISCLFAMSTSRLARLRRIENDASALQLQQEFDLAALLVEVHLKKLYRFRDFSSFGAYVDAYSSVYRVGRRQAYRLVRGAHILAHLKGHRLPPPCEKQVRMRASSCLKDTFGSKLSDRTAYTAFPYASQSPRELVSHISCPRMG